MLDHTEPDLERRRRARRRTDSQRLVQATLIFAVVVSVGYGGYVAFQSGPKDGAAEEHIVGFEPVAPEAAPTRDATSTASASELQGLLEQVRLEFDSNRIDAGCRLLGRRTAGTGFADASPTELADLHHILGACAVRRGSYALGKQHLDKAFAIFNKAKLKAPTKLVRAFIELADGWSQKSQLGKSAHAYERAIAIYRGRPDHDPQRLAVFLRRLGVILRMAREYVRAVDTSAEELKLLRRSLPESHVDVLRARSSYGDALRGVGRTAEALKTQQAALADMERHLGRDHPLAAYAHNRAGLALNDLNRPADAEKAFRRSLEIRLAKLPPSHAQVFRSAVNLATAVLRLKRHEEARRLLAFALRYARTFPEPTPVAELEVRYHLTMSFLDDGLFKETYGCQREALRLFLKTPGLAWKDRGQTQLTMVWVLIIRNAREEAVRMLDAAMKTANDAGPEARRGSIALLASLADTFGETGWVTRRPWAGTLMALGRRWLESGERPTELVAMLDALGDRGNSLPPSNDPLAPALDPKQIAQTLGLPPTTGHRCLAAIEAVCRSVPDCRRWRDVFVEGMLSAGDRAEQGCSILLDDRAQLDRQIEAAKTAGGSGTK